MEREATARQIKEMLYTLGKALNDAEKFDAGGAGSDAAGTRVRKAMQEAKNAAQGVRETVSEVKSTRKPEEQPGE